MVTSTPTGSPVLTGGAPVSTGDPSHRSGATSEGVGAPLQGACSLLSYIPGVLRTLGY